MFLSALLLALVWQVTGQRPVIPAGSPEYLFMPPITESSVYIYYTTGTHGCSVSTLDFKGNAYTPGHPVTVYGVAVISEWIDRYPYLWVYLMEDHIADSVNGCYDLDTVAAELFCFIERPPVSYADFQFPWTGSLVLPFYEFYFSRPIQVPAGKRFFVGVSHSEWNVYNHWRKGDPYYPDLFFNSPRFTSRRTSFNDPQDPTCIGDGLDSTWSIEKYYFPGLIDWACNRCLEPLANPATVPYYHKYTSHGFFPIVRPPEDSARVHPPHEDPLRAGAVEAFRVTEADMSHATFAWTEMEPSDWGLVGVNAEAYAVNYAPYGQAYAEGDTVMSVGGECTLRMAFDSTVMYKARCRARSRHVCDLHDTLVWGEWSEEVYFHTGVGVPDTGALSCCAVDGVRYAGMVSGCPRFTWERCEGADRYETQYAEVGGDGWHRGTTTTMTDYILRAELRPGRRYMVRVRSLCDHRCHVHDTVVSGEWGDTAYYPETVGVEESWEEGACLFSLKPNPARGSVAVGLSLGAEEYPAVLTVADGKGREVLRREVDGGGRQVLDLQGLPAGAYLVTLTTRSRRTGTQRLVVE